MTTPSALVRINLEWETIYGPVLFAAVPDNHGLWVTVGWQRAEAQSLLQPLFGPERVIEQGDWLTARFRRLDIGPADMERFLRARLGHTGFDSAHWWYSRFGGDPDTVIVDLDWELHTIVRLQYTQEDLPPDYIQAHGAAIMNSGLAESVDYSVRLGLDGRSMPGQLNIGLTPEAAAALVTTFDWLVQLRPALPM